MNNSIDNEEGGVSIEKQRESSQCCLEPEVHESSLGLELLGAQITEVKASFRGDAPLPLAPPLRAVKHILLPPPRTKKKKFVRTKHPISWLP